MSMGLEPGDLQEEVTILEDVGSATDSLQGREAADFQPLANDAEEYVRIRPLSARQRLVADQRGVPAKYDVTMRYREDVDTTNRLRWDSNGARELVIVSGPLDTGEHQEWIMFTAKEDRD